MIDVDIDMTPAQFRRIALSMPQAVEGKHMGHPDFRVGGRIFATLFSRDDVDWGMVKLTQAQQRQFMKSHAAAFEPCSGAWGRNGATQVGLGAIDRATARNAILTAWRNTASKRLLDQHESDSS